MFSISPKTAQATNRCRCDSDLGYSRCASHSFEGLKDNKAIKYTYFNDPYQECVEGFTGILEYMYINWALRQEPKER